jgi:hypothetical protein
VAGLVGDELQQHEAQAAVAEDASAAAQAPAQAVAVFAAGMAVQEVFEGAHDGLDVVI